MQKNISEVSMDKREVEEYLALLEVATYYYVDNLSQKEIANKLFYSTAKVSRMLKKIIDQKIVSITINYPNIRQYHLEEKIKLKFGLKECLVLGNISKQSINSDFSYYAFGANYLSKIMINDLKIAISSGKTIYSILDQLPLITGVNTVLVQPKGMSNLEHKTSYDCPVNIELLTRKMNDCRSELLYAPLYVKNQIVRDHLFDENVIKRVINGYDNVDVLLTSIASFNEKNSQTWSSFINNDDYLRLKKYNIKASLLGHFLNADGQVIQPYDFILPIGMSVAQIKNIQQSILFVNGESKCQATLAVLKSKLINTLICDNCIGEYLCR